MSSYYYNEDADENDENDDTSANDEPKHQAGERRSYDRRPSTGGPRDDDRRGGGRDGDSRGGGGGRFRRGRKVCYFCSNKVDHIDYKDVDLLRRFQTDRGRIRPRRQSGACARHQRKLANAIKRARHIALLPFVVDDSP